MELNKENSIVAAICLIFFVVIGFLFWKGPTSATTEAKNPALLVKSDSHMTGKATAKVTMVEFGDYQCPACGIVSKEVTKVLDAYKTNPDFNYVFRNFPLQQHKNAVIGAEAAESAGAQGKYFEMEDALYANQEEWGESKDPMPLLQKYAKSLGLDMNKFSSDMTSHIYKSKIDADVADGNALSIDHTPTIYINGVEQTDNGFESLKKVIDTDLNK